MFNPFFGVDWRDPWDYLWVAYLFASTVAVPTCIATLFAGGWFLLGFWWILGAELQPEANERHRAAIHAEQRHRRNAGRQLKHAQTNGPQRLPDLRSRQADEIRKLID